MWKTKTLHQCITPGMQLWMGLQMLRLQANETPTYKEVTYKIGGYTFKDMVRTSSPVKYKEIETFFNKCKGGQVRRKALVSAIQAVGYKWVTTPGKYRFEYVF